MTLETLEKRALTLGIRMRPQHFKLLYILVKDDNIIDYVISASPENIKSSLREDHFMILHHDGTMNKSWLEDENTFLGVYQMFDGEKITYVIAFPKDF